jgi:hypothetical protein
MQSKNDEDTAEALFWKWMNNNNDQHRYLFNQQHPSRFSVFERLWHRMILIAHGEKRTRSIAILIRISKNEIPNCFSKSTHLIKGRVAPLEIEFYFLLGLCFTWSFSGPVTTSTQTSENFNNREQRHNPNTKQPIAAAWFPWPVLARHFPFAIAWEERWHLVKMLENALMKKFWNFYHVSGSLHIYLKTQAILPSHN